MRVVVILAAAGALFWLIQQRAVKNDGDVVDTVTAKAAPTQFATLPDDAKAYLDQKRNRSPLTASDLLPKDQNSVWAEVNPTGTGDLQHKNFIDPTYQVGINTVGTSLRNANTGLRSEPANPRVTVSPWQQSTIEADLMRRPLDP